MHKACYQDSFQIVHQKSGNYAILLDVSYEKMNYVMRMQTELYSTCHILIITILTLSTQNFNIELYCIMKIMRAV